MLPTSLPSPLASAGPGKRGQGASLSPIPAADSRGTPDSEGWSPRSRRGRSQAGDRDGSKARAISFLADRKPQTPLRATCLPPKTLPAALPASSGLAVSRTDTSVNWGLKPTGIHRVCPGTARTGSRDGEDRPPAHPTPSSRGVPSPSRGSRGPKTSDRCPGAEPARPQGPDRTAWESPAAPVRRLGARHGPGGHGCRPGCASSRRAPGSRASLPAPRAALTSHALAAPHAGVHSPAPAGPQETRSQEEVAGPQGPREPGHPRATCRPPAATRRLERARGRGLSGSEATGGFGNLEWPARKRLRTSPRAPARPAP